MGIKLSSLTNPAIREQATREVSRQLGACNVTPVHPVTVTWWRVWQDCQEITPHQVVQVKKVIRQGDRVTLITFLHSDGTLDTEESECLPCWMWFPTFAEAYAFAYETLRKKYNQASENIDSFTARYPEPKI